MAQKYVYIFKVQQEMFVIIPIGCVSVAGPAQEFPCSIYVSLNVYLFSTKFIYELTTKYHNMTTGHSSGPIYLIAVC